MSNHSISNRPAKELIFDSVTDEEKASDDGLLVGGEEGRDGGLSFLRSSPHLRHPV